MIEQTIEAIKTMAAAGKTARQIESAIVAGKIEVRPMHADEIIAVGMALHDAGCGIRAVNRIMEKCGVPGFGEATPEERFMGHLRMAVAAHDAATGTDRGAQTLDRLRADGVSGSAIAAGVRAWLEANDAAE